MPGLLVYAKKIRLPSKSANILQSLNMCLAFAEAGQELSCFPGCAAVGEASAPVGERRARVLENALAELGADAVPSGWHMLPGERKGAYGLHFRWAVGKAMLRHTDALCFARDTGEALFLCRLNRLLRRPLLYEAHEVLHLMQKHEGKPYWRKTLQQERVIAAHAAGVIAVNAAVAEAFRASLGYHGPLLTAPNGYTPALFPVLPLFTDAAPWPGAEAAVTCVYVGNFLPGKGVPELLDAFVQLPRRFRLRLVGGFPEAAFAEARAGVRERGLEERVEFLGAVPQRDVRKACSGAHVFVIPQQSDFYFSPLKLYEAMALGLPVVTSALPLFAPHAEAGLVLAAPGPGGEGLAEAIRQVAATPELAAGLRERGLREAAQHTWPERARAILRFAAELPAWNKRLHPEAEPLWKR